MHINLFLIPFIIILGLLFAKSDVARNRGLYITICSAVLVFVAAMRSPEWMTGKYLIDTMNYKLMFEDSFDMSWGEFWNNVYQRYYMHEGESDIGFLALNKIIGWFTHDFHVFSLIADLLFFIPFGIILYRYSTSMPQLIFAFVFYIALVQIYFFGGARQIFAMGFDMMAMLSVINKKVLRTIIFILIGVSIHFSSFLFIFPLILIWYNVSGKTLKLFHFIGFLLFPIVLLYPRELIVFMGETLNMEKYAEYGRGAIQGGATTFIILIEILSLFILYSIRTVSLYAHKELCYFYVMAPSFTILAPLIHADGSMVRISLYYFIFVTLLVPYGIDCMFRIKDRGYAYTVAIGVLSFLTLSGGGITYYFYWQM